MANVCFVFNVSLFFGKPKCIAMSTEVSVNATSYSFISSIDLGDEFGEFIMSNLYEDYQCLMVKQPSRTSTSTIFSYARTSPFPHR